MNSGRLLLSLSCSAFLLTACAPPAAVDTEGDRTAQDAVTEVIGFSITGTPCRFGSGAAPTSCGLVTTRVDRSRAEGTIAAVELAQGFDVRLSSSDRTGFIVLARFGNGSLSGDLATCLGHPTHVYSNGSGAPIYTDSADADVAHDLDDCGVRGVEALYLGQAPSATDGRVTGIAEGRVYTTAGLGEACSAVQPCYDGLACTDGTCALRHGGLGAACARATDCTAGLTCDKDHCAALLGGSCASTSDCASVLVCDEASRSCRLPQ